MSNIDEETEKAKLEIIAIIKNSENKWDAQNKLIKWLGRYDIEISNCLKKYNSIKDKK